MSNKILRHLILFLSLTLINNSLVAESTGMRAGEPYFKAKVGCFVHLKEILKLECDEQIIAFNILKTLSSSRRRNSKRHLNDIVTERAKYFISRNKYDYMSVLSLMVFPIKEKMKYLEEFKKIPGKRAHFTTIAIERIKGKKPKYCKRQNSRGVPIYYKEICSLNVAKI